MAFSVVLNNERIRNIYEIEASIMDFFSMQAESIQDPTYQQAFETNRANHNQNMERLREIITRNRYLLIALMVIVIAQGVILYALLIRQSHRISGPIYVMSNQIRDILKGKTPSMRPLRQKDELKDFYNLLGQLLDRYDEKETADNDTEGSS
jgi:signal transduction histidine kinase